MKLVITVSVLIAACGGAAPTSAPMAPADDSRASSPAPPASPSAAEPDPVVELACTDRIARAQAHFQSVAAHARDQEASTRHDIPVPIVVALDGSERDPKALLVRYEPRKQGPIMIVGANKGVTWKGRESVAAVMTFVRAHRGTKVVELELARKLDATDLDALLVELSSWGRVRLIVAKSYFNRDRLVIPQSPAWAASVLDAGPDDRRTLLQDGMKRAISSCAPLRDAFADNSGVSDFVSRFPAALAQCDCSATNPEAVGTLAGMLIAIADRETGWIDVVARKSGGAPVAVTQNPGAATITIDQIVSKLGELPADVRRAGVSLELVREP